MKRPDPDSLAAEFRGIGYALHALAGHLRAEHVHLDEIETQLRSIRAGDVQSEQASTPHPENT